MKNKPFQNFSLKPFDCSFCLVHHTLAIYLLYIQQFTLFNYLCACMLSFNSNLITELLVILKDKMLRLIQIIDNKYF